MNIAVSVFRLQLTCCEKEVFDKILVNSKDKRLYMLKKLFRKYRNDRSVICNRIYILWKDEEKRSLFLTEEEIKICSKLDSKLKEISLITNNKSGKYFLIDFYVSDIIVSADYAKSVESIEFLCSSLDNIINKIKFYT